MGIALELMPVLDLWMMFPEIADEVADGGALAFHGAGTQGGSHPAQVALEGCLRSRSFTEQIPGEEFFDGLEIEGAEFGVLDLHVSDGGVRGAVSHHLGQCEQRGSMAGHIGAKGMAKPVGVGGVSTPEVGAVIPKDRGAPPGSGVGRGGVGA